MEFDLMKDKPVLDIQTLNWIWDRIWRHRACNRGRNADQRSRASEDTAIIAIIELEADTITTAP